MQATKQLKVKGDVVAQYNTTVDVLFLKMVSRKISRKEVIALISELEKIEFAFVSDLP